MLTRLRVCGFRNLVDVDVRFGPMTLLVGCHGSGKSNLLDAIRLTAALADQPISEAFKSVPDVNGDTTSLFTRSNETIGDRITLQAECLIPAHGDDDLGQTVEPSATLLCYKLSLRRSAEYGIRLESESLHHIHKRDSRASLGFEHTKAWRDSVVFSSRHAPLLSTDPSGQVVLHQDQGSNGSGGGPRRFESADLPRTVLSSVSDASQHRTAVLLRSEMRSWLHLPPDQGLESSTLRDLAMSWLRQHPGQTRRDWSRTVLRSLRSLITAEEIDVERASLVLHSGIPQPLATLSTGRKTALFLAAARLIPRRAGLLLVEHPERGLHPVDLPPVVQLLRSLAFNPTVPSGDTNPTRQVICTTHAPQIAQRIPKADLVVAHLDPTGSRAIIDGLPGTWRRPEELETPSEQASWLQALDVMLGKRSLSIGADLTSAVQLSLFGGKKPT